MAAIVQLTTVVSILRTGKREDYQQSQFLNSSQWVSRLSTITFILEVSRGPIHGTVTRELDMNGFWDFQQILVYSAADLLKFIDSFSFNRVRIE